MDHVVMFSGGIGSWMAAKRVCEQYGTDGLVLLFADVKGGSTNPHVGEDEDTYRFIREAAADIGGRLVTLNDGRDIWQVFRDRRFLGNARIANCSQELKQKPARAWLDANCSPDTTTVYVGIDWTESHRLPAIERSYLPYVAKAPLTVPPFIDKDDMISACVSAGIAPPRLYASGFSHNNCGGGCVRAGQAQFQLLLSSNRPRYMVWEENEQGMRDFLGADVAILRDRRGGTSVPLTLRSFRERLEVQPEAFDAHEFGGCGCFSDPGSSPAPSS